MNRVPFLRWLLVSCFTISSVSVSAQWLQGNALPVNEEQRLLSGEALHVLGIASAEIIAQGIRVLWSEQNTADLLIGNLKRHLPNGITMRFDGQGSIRATPSSESGLPSIIILPDPSPTSERFPLPSETRLILTKENLHTVALSVNYLKTGSFIDTSTSDGASSLKGQHVLTTITGVARLTKSTTTALEPTPLGWDEKEDAYLFQQKTKDSYTELEKLGAKETEEVLKSFAEELNLNPSIKPEPSGHFSDSSAGNQYSHQPRMVSHSTVEGRVQATPSPTPSPETTGYSNDLYGPVSYRNVTLPGREKAHDYSHDRNFSERMKVMSYAEADEMRKLINKYPDHYPMPGMKETANIIQESLVWMKSVENLSDEDHGVLNRLEKDVQKLVDDDVYPYRESLGLSYRALHYKSWLDYQKQYEIHIHDMAKGKETYTTVEVNCLESDFREANIRRISVYMQPCTLKKLEQLPWEEMLNQGSTFSTELSRLYHSDALHRDNKEGDADNSGFNALTSGIPIIPCLHELDICFFNLTAGLPLWLAGFSMSKSTRADGYDMCPSAFFDHDLFHLALVMKYLKRHPETNREELLNSIRSLYCCKGDIHSVSFKAVELAIFFHTHEQGRLELPRWIFQNIKFSDLPEDYEKTTRGQVYQAYHWLIDLHERMSGEIASRVKDTDAAFIPVEPCENADETYPIASITPDYVRVLQKLIEQKGKLFFFCKSLSWGHLLNLLARYTALDNIPQDEMDISRLFQCTERTQIQEAHWLACFYEKYDYQPGHEQECMALASDAYNAFRAHYYANLQRLDHSSRKIIEELLAEYLRKYPAQEQDESGLLSLAFHLETHGLSWWSMYRTFRTYLAYQVLREDYSGFWFNHRVKRTDNRDPKPVCPYTCLGKVENGRVSLWIWEYPLSQLFEPATEERIKQMKLRGYKSPDTK